MNDTTQTPAHPAELEAALVQLGLSDMLDGYVARARVGVRYLSIERLAARHGYRIAHEDGNVYGRVRLEPISTAPTPRLRLVTRSDVAAVHGTRRAA